MTDTLYSASAVATKLGLSRQRVIELAKARGLGQGPSPTVGVWLFTEADVEAMSKRAPGRPRKP